ncbi:autotransporter-associated beta strand repeat-containing protein [Luteolibacter arcticus]|uniref:Autotransporter-associated beta strand repeat-containing protein n=1 Tax=Luteolibacter arcticus TaxID=1581411 RepID=A0ABT3GT05_9BACT|nr:autotransporter-associated beta strand repeat-containing protein [Luteolibacter arcticus]MCW1926600.1 autotransporter-associated beta strand repeat-containing protein [Luteolibacter arcticus]
MKSPIHLSSFAALVLVPVCHAGLVFSWETGTEGWSSSAGNPAVTGDETVVSTTTTGATEGTQSLAVSTPMGVAGGWHGMWYSTPTQIDLDPATRQALFTGATEIKLDVSYPNPGYNSWYGDAKVELIIQGDGVNWTPLGEFAVPVGGAPQTYTWPVTVGNAQALANGTWGKLVLKFTYGNGGSNSPNAVFHLDNLRSTVVIVEPPIADYFWKGGTSASWADLNWTTDPEGTTAAGPIVSDGSKTVAFTAAEADNFTTVLGADQNMLAMVFTAGSGLIEVGGTHNLTLGANGILSEANSGPAILNTTGQIILGANQLWANQASSIFTVDSQVAGSGKLTTGGSGTTLLNAANVHTGGTAVQQGSLVLGNAQALGPATTSVTVAGGTIDLNGFSPTIGGLAGSLGGVITNTAPEAATLTLDDDTGSTFGGALNASSFGEPLSFVKTGSGTLVLNGTGTFTGNVSVQEGQVTASSFANGVPNATNFGNAQTAGRTITVESGAVVMLGTNNIFGNQQGDASLLPTLVLNGGFLDASRYNLIGPVSLVGGVLSQSASDAGTYQGYQFKGNLTVTGSAPSIIQSPTGKANHLSTDTVFDVADATGDELADLIVSNPLTNQSGDFASATGGLTKSGAGTMALQATNTYTGTTRVSAGTLSLGTASLGDDSTVEIAAGAFLQLDHSSTDTINRLVIGEDEQEEGIYGAIDSGAEHETPRITGTGFLLVVADPFLTWMTGFPSLIGVDAEKSADPDHDGLTNLDEFALDGNPASGAPNGKVRRRVETVGADQALVITLPVRQDAAFTGTAPAVATVAADGVTYEIAGSNDLSVFDQNVSEVTPALTGNPVMPDLNAGWIYRTFRLDGAVGGGTPRGPKGFLRAKITPAP